MFSKILIANRGEIACRVAATARKMGIQSVAVYSDADAHAKHVAACDEAIWIGAAPARESYLCIDKIIAAALQTGAQAIHPGYGFLSENADFADACLKAGLIFIGPPASAIRAMGSKSAAKSLMEKAGVPLVPGYHGDLQDADFLQTQADLIAYPVLLKPSAGGGGKGMRVVESAADFKAALISCKREAISAFGDDQVLIEKYLLRPRHIEIQLFADTHGNCIHLFERDCSVQRRHQKVLEEAPAPGMTESRRAAMGQAAIAAAQAVGYVGAGTVEFIVNQDGSFYFMEMNTRLQVEHPVTEMITGLDLVEWQLRVAFGEALPLQQADIAAHGHAIEARIYAENPDTGFLPSIGTLRHVRFPAALQFSTEFSMDLQVRVDAGVREGDTISPFYDPMIAKLIVHGQDRAEALANMGQALAACQVVGVASNIAFLKRLIASDAFLSADLDTGLIGREGENLFPPPQNMPLSTLALAAVGLLAAEKGGSDPWSHTDGWRMNGSLQRRLDFSDKLNRYSLSVIYKNRQWQIGFDGNEMTVGLQGQDGTEFGIMLDGMLIHATVVRDGNIFHVFGHDGNHRTLSYHDSLAYVSVDAEATGGRLTAPMPGKVITVFVKPAQHVKKGEPLIVMEAMKMEHTITAPHDGVIENIFYAVGAQVIDGAPLLAFALVE